MAVQLQKIMPVARAKRPDEILAESEHDSIWLREIFLEAKNLKATDIHIKPVLNPETWDIHLEAKLFINGEKRLYSVLEDENIVDSVITKLKVLAKFDLSTAESCQDQAFSLRLTRCRYRANLMPTEIGEAFVLRVINADDIPGLLSLNLSENLIADYRRALQRKKGLILFTGNTGSGKSTTVESGLMEVDREKKEVLALQEPPERLLPDVKHVPINRHVPWNQALRAAMRAAPQVIYIGEIRDRDSAQQALAASNTGHLVISTLHVSRVAGVFDRLSEWGIEKQIIADNLLFITNQTLIPRICSYCRAKEPHSGYVQGDGCENCDNGIDGRVPLVEYSFEPSRQKMIDFSKADFEESEINQTFYEDAQRLASEGLISMREARLWEAAL